MKNSRNSLQPANTAAGKQEKKHTQEIENAVDSIEPSKIVAVVKKLSAYPTRFHRAPLPHQYIDDLQNEFARLAVAAARSVEVERIGHKTTCQQSVRARVYGTDPGKKSEVVILCAHLDSTHKDKDQRLLQAPGADDNASGVAVVLEAYRVFLNQSPRQRTVEFHLYAGEEEELIGSTEISASYKAAQIDVIAVLNLDMVMYPGSGVGNVFLAMHPATTSAWLHGYLISVNSKHVGAKIEEVRCSTGSDHSSWSGLDYHAAWAVEANCLFKETFPERHTEKDKFDLTVLNKEHAAVFAKLAVSFALDLSSSDERGNSIN